MSILNRPGPTSLTPLDKTIIFHLSGDLGLSTTPYAELAAKLGIEEERLLAVIRQFQNQGLVRRLGATLRHQRSGFQANAMVVWRIRPEEIQARGEALAKLHYVSHCYQRQTAPGWPFNLYTMIHAETSEHLAVFLEEMAEICQASEWRILKSLKEFKKTSLRYFDQIESPGSF